jgi:hypothetical protein
MRRWLGLLAAALVLAGCTGIPASSAPQVVRTVPGASISSVPQPQIAPRPGEGPGDLVKEFLAAGVDADAGHSTARQFLTKDASRGWADNPTIVLDEANPGDVVLSDTTASVPVRGRRVGQLDANGVFTPTLKGMGAGDEETFTYDLTRAASHCTAATTARCQWRIAQLPPGVVIDSSKFTTAYKARKLYFFDPTGNLLVPDLRYSPLKQVLPQVSWLLTQLLAGPRPELAQSVLDEVPDQIGKPSVQIGNPTIVDIPGTAQLDSDARDALAAQLAFTLSQVGVPTLELTDTGKPVRIPSATGLQFGPSNFSSVSPDKVELDGNGIYFVRAGTVVNGKGSPVPNLLGRPGRYFSSVALRRNSSNSLDVAAMTTTRQLLIGDERRPLTPITLPHAATSRPEWRPFAEDVWFGAGDRDGSYGIYRVTSDGPVEPVSITSQVGTVPNASITALRFSPDGTRIALVTRSAEDTGTAWIGSLVTSGLDVRIDSLEPITPPALAVTDLAWTDSVTLQLVAAVPGAEAALSAVNSDGSRLETGMTNINLPGPPVAITAALGQPTVVEAGGTLWSLPKDGSTWTSISGNNLQVPGHNPTYAP